MHVKKRLRDILNIKVHLIEEFFLLIFVMFRTIYISLDGPLFDRIVILGERGNPPFLDPVYGKFVGGGGGQSDL